MDWADEVRIETPEQIDVGLEIAGLGSRFVAQMVDWLVKGVVVVGVLLVLSIAGAASGGLGGGGLATHVLAIALAFLFVFFLGFDIYYEVQHNGQTPGKRLAGIRVIREGGAPVDFRAGCIRNLLGLVDMLPSFYVVGSVLILVTAKDQRLGDLAAGTLVIRERVLRAPDDAFDPIEGYASDEFAFTADQLRACAPGDRFVIRSFFQRYSELEAGARQRLVFRLADQFLHKTGFALREPIMDPTRAEQFLASLYRDLKARASSV